MWSEEINKKIQEAGDKSQPAYSEKAWENMELLLDKHLPLKKKRRRFIFWLFPLALAGTTIFFIVQKKMPNDISIAEKKNMLVQPSSISEKLSESPVNITTLPKRISARAEPFKATMENDLSKIKTQDSSIAITERSYTKKSYPDQRRQDPKQNPSFLRKRAIKKTEVPATDFLPGKTTVRQISAPTENATENNPTLKPVAIDSYSIQKTIVKDDKKREDSPQTETSQTNTKKTKNKISAGSKIGLNISVGTDMSSVGLHNRGSLELLYGIGASYALSKRFSIRTGLFAGVKKYTADSADYHLHYSINNLQKVEADCYVYEIPLTFVYNFPVIKKHNWFISGGLSSYLMKKETYEYFYKNSWGQQQSYSRTYKNENSHFFSVVNFSGGYQYHFTPRFSIMAEPYIKIAANGIGSGEVNLNSAGLLFTIGYKPFLKEK